MPRWFAALLLTLAAASCSSNSATLTSPTPDKCELALSPDTTTIAASGGDGRVSVTTTPECAWSANTQAPWISGISPASGQGSGQIQFRVAPNSVPAAREGDLAVNDQRARVRQEAATCEFDIAPDAIDIGPGGGTAPIALTTLAGCAWSASSDVSWIDVSPASGNGNAAVRLDIAPNGGTARQGTVSIAGRVVTVRQSSSTPTPPACNYVIAPRNQTIAASGGAGGPVAVSAPPGCAWTAQSNVPWITITAGQNGTGSGAVAFAVEANSGPGRTGTLTIATDTFVVTQSSAESCSYIVSPTTQSVGPSGGVAPPVQVTTTPSCAWTATSGASWITVRSGASGSGNGTVTYEVGANSGAARTGTVTIAGQAVTVTQQAAACAYAIAPSSQTVGAAGGPGTPITLTTGLACAWTAESSASWITITSARTGTGPATITFTVAANTGSSGRRGVITVGGQTFTVDQEAAALQCSFEVEPTSHAGSAIGYTATTSVRTAAACSWTARSNDPWITITAGASGSGNGSVSFAVAPNLVGERSGTLTVADRTVTVTQSAVLPCVYAIAPTRYRADEDGGDGPPVAVTTTGGCAWTAVSNVDWIQITSGASGSGSGTVRFRVQRNDGRRREGTLTIAGQTFTVTQESD